MEQEFLSSMQACVACAIALDAFYATVKDCIDLPSDLTDTWRKNRTSRYAQVAEVLRRAFEVHPSKDDQLRNLVKEVFRFRDKAVHPSAEPQQPIRLPDVELGVAWRFVAFHNKNARLITKLSISLVSQCVAVPRADFPALVRHCKSAVELVGPIKERYRAAFGHGTEEEEGQAQ